MRGRTIFEGVHQETKLLLRLLGRKAKTTEHPLLQFRLVNPDGTAGGANADSPHPLDCEELLSPAFEVFENKALLEFHEKPDKILNISCWSDENWGNIEAEPENVDYKGNEMTLKPGGNIYEITAKWNADNGYGGTASYYTYIEYME